MTILIITTEPKVIEIVDNNKADVQKKVKRVYVVEKILSQEEAKKNALFMGNYAKNYLPIFFNIYSTISGEERPLIHSAIEAFLYVADAKVNKFNDRINTNQLVKTFFSNVVSKLLQAGTKKNENEDENEIQYLTELSDSFVEYLDEESLQFLLKVVAPQLSVRKKIIH